MLNICSLLKVRRGDRESLDKQLYKKKFANIFILKIHQRPEDNYFVFTEELKFQCGCKMLREFKYLIAVKILVLSLWVIMCSFVNACRSFGGTSLPRLRGGWRRENPECNIHLIWHLKPLTLRFWPQSALMFLKRFLEQTAIISFNSID